MNFLENVVEKMYVSFDNNKLYRDQVLGCNTRYYYDSVIRKAFFKKCCLVMYVDVNNLKYINDTYGHYAGTELLKKVVHDLYSLHKNIIICRLGGDEFIVILPIRCKINICSQIDFSYGLCYKEKFEDITNAMRKAEISMYFNKKNFH